MPIKVIVSTISGIVCGRLFLNEAFVEMISIDIHLGIMTISVEELILGFILIFVGMELSKQQDILIKIKKIGIKVFLVPLAVVVSSLLGGMIAAMILQMPIHEVLAISSGMGWYSFAAVELGRYSATIGAIALLVNVGRELAVFIFAKIFNKYGGKLGMVGIAGVTCMDVTLPYIQKINGEMIGVIAFISGTILGLVVPILLPLFISL